MSTDYSQQVADILDALGDSPTPDEAYHATRNYDERYVAAALASAVAANAVGGGSQPVLKTTVHLSSAQLLALTAFDNPAGWVTAIASPGAGFGISSLGATWVYTAGATPYTLVDTVNIGLTTLPATDLSAASVGLVAETNAAGLLDESVSTWKQSKPNEETGPGNIAALTSDTANKAVTVVLDRAGADITTGNGTLDITLLYYVVAMPT